MAKTRRRRSLSTPPTGATRLSPAGPSAARVGRSKPRPRVGRAREVGRPRWWVSIAMVALVVAIGLVGWWASIAFRGDDKRATAGGVDPIATLESPDVHSILVDPNDLDHVFFGSHSGIQESRDGGFTWDVGGLRDADAMGLAVSPKDATTLYAAGHDVFQLSRDGGKTWQPLGHNLPGADVHAFAQDPSEPGRLYAYLAGGDVFASGDGGITWAPLPTQPPGGGAFALASNGTALYAATQAGIVSSRDHGATWALLPAQPPGGAITLAVTAADPLRLYVGTQTGLVKSSDDGRTWSLVGPPDVLALALAVAPSEPNRVMFVAEGGGVYRSDDGGVSWIAPR